MTASRSCGDNSESEGVLQLVVGETANIQCSLPEAKVPQQCPSDVWELIGQCTDGKPSSRPSAKRAKIVASNAYLLNVETTHLTPIPSPALLPAFLSKNIVVGN